MGERPPLTAGRLIRRIERLLDFGTSYPGLIPDNVRSAAFHARLRIELPQLLALEPLVWHHLRAQRDYVALCHWNANVDNAWFWPDANGAALRADGLGLRR